MIFRKELELVRNEVDDGDRERRAETAEEEEGETAIDQKENKLRSDAEETVKRNRNLWNGNKKFAATI